MSFLNVKKSSRSALAIVPPESLWEPINAIRRKHDKQLVRWMPHLSLLFPFVHPDFVDDELPVLAEVAATVRPFSITFGELRHFEHPTGTSTLWLAPAPRAPLDALYRALVERYPDLDTAARFETGFTPHLSVGQTGSHLSGHRISQELQKVWQPLELTVDALSVLTRPLSGPFEVHCRVELQK
ncbi:MAG: 2'-5' RNA ligase family protein [bacterium]